MCSLIGSQTRSRSCEAEEEGGKSCADLAYNPSKNRVAQKVERPLKVSQVGAIPMTDVGSLSDGVHLFSYHA